MKAIIHLQALLVVIALPLFAQSPGHPLPHPEIQLVQGLSFGGLLVDNAGGGITLTADGALIALGPGIQANAQPPCNEARFRLSGPPGAAFTLKVDPQFPMLKGPSGGSVRVAEFQTLQGFKGTFNALGQADFKLGARLDIEANTAPGEYRATQMKLQLFLAGGGSETATMPFQITALLRAGLRLANSGPMDFGVILAGSQPGRFELLPNGGHHSAAGGPTLLKGNPRPAQFAIAGYPGTTYTIQLPKSTKLAGPGASIGVEDFTCSTALSGALPPGGLNFGVGASLMVQAAQAPGAYRGTFMVTVNYP